MIDSDTLIVDDGEYELLTLERLAQDIRYANNSIVDEIAELMRTHGEGMPLLEGESGRVFPIDSEYFLPGVENIQHGEAYSFDPSTSRCCLTVRRKRKLIGALTFERIKLKAHAMLLGEVDRAVVVAAERTSSFSTKKQQTSVAENLMHIALTTLINEFRCTVIRTQPITVQGERYAIRHGFELDKESPNGYFLLSPEIISAVRAFLDELPDHELQWSKIGEAITILKHATEKVLEEKKRERRFHIK